MKRLLIVAVLILGLVFFLAINSFAAVGHVAGGQHAAAADGPPQVIDQHGLDRAAAIADADAGTVILTTYGLLNTQEEQLVEKEWGCICLDEAHTIKNRDTKTSAVCMKLQSKHRIILTGMPLQNHLGELWNLFQFINTFLLFCHGKLTGHTVCSSSLPP